MGVHGLWRLIEPSGKPVPLETLENKILAVDVSIWLHQAIKGFQDSKGAPLPNAHLLGIYHRVCKLLYFKVKPVFIFDGGVPALKKQTIAKRNQQKSKNHSDANKIQKQILNTLLKHTAIAKVLSEKTKALLPISPKKPSKDKDDTDIFKLPPSQLDIQSSSDDEDYASSSSTYDTVSDSSPTKHWDLQSVDPKSSQFKSLPADVRHEILTDLKETRKQNSWGRLHELPTHSDDFAGFQMKKLLKRYTVQVCLEEAEKEMGGHSLSLGELESLLNDHGVITDTEIADKISSRIASDENTRYLYIKDVKKALEKARIESINLKTVDENLKIENNQEVNDEKFENDLEEAIKISKNDELNNETSEIKEEQKFPVKKVLYKDEFERDLEKAIQLSLENEASTSGGQYVSVKTNSAADCISSVDDFKDADFDSDSSNDETYTVKTKSTAFSAVKNYMLEYGGLTPSGVEDIFNGTSKQTKNSRNVFKKSSKLVGIPDVEKQIANVERIEVHETNPEDQQSASHKEEIDTTVELSDTTKIDCNNGKKNDVEMESINVSSVEVHPKPFLTHQITPIENISSSDSDSSQEFLEVAPNLENNVSQSLNPKLEIIIQPKDDLGDDLFSDIFCDNADSNLVINNKSFEKIIPEEEPQSKTELILNNQSKNIENKLKKLEVENQNDKNSAVANEDRLIKHPIEEIRDEVKKKNAEEKEKTKQMIQEIIKPVLTEPQDGNATPILSAEQLKQIESNLIQEKNQLISERSTKERLAGNITDQMYQEAQELLQLFGVPYLIAPMEAEAQCAFLDEINLTDGTITDDSDIWLFGGRTVYKNFFNQSKHVAEYKSENIQHHFKLSRDQLILLALLVGSDYTTGIQGIGPVTALEILAAFPASKENNDKLSTQQLMSGLRQFRSWFNKGKLAGAGRAGLRTKLKNIEFSENFPSLQVIQAYLDPKVETSKEKFSWGKPNLVYLTDYAKEKFGWTRLKSEEILKPVFKRLEEKQSQTTIRDYFKTKHKLDSVDLQERMSKRVKKAVNKMGKGEHDSSSEEDVKILKKTQKVSKKKVKQTEIGEEKNDLSLDEDVKILKKTQKVSKKKVRQVEEDIKNQLETKKKIQRPNLHNREFIPQKEIDKSAIMRNKLRAIEVFRKSKQGPGFLKKRIKTVRKPKDNAELSESSSD